MKLPAPWLLVAAVALAASATSLRNGFAYDDVPVARDDERIRSLDVRRIVTMPYWDDSYRDRIYRPVTSLSLALDWRVGRGAALPFHATNVLLNCLVAVLVFALARRLLGGGPESAGALAGALLFAVHPVHVEVVASVVGRAELLAAAGYLAAVLAAGAGFDASLAGNRRRSAALLVTTGVAAAVAYGAKEHALTLPLLLLLLALADGRRRGLAARDSLRHGALPVTVTLLLAAGFLAARAAVVGSAFGGGAVAAGLEGLSAGGRLMVMLPALLVWARLLFFPARLSADYSPAAFEPLASPGLEHAAALVLIAAVTGLAWAARRRVPGIALGAAWFVVTASVAANVVVPTGVLIAERVLYLPSAGVAIAAGAGFATVQRWRAAWPVLLAAVVLLAGRGLARIPVWRDNDSVFASVLRDAPDSYRSHWILGTRAWERGEAAAGERHMLDAIRIHPADPILVAELGTWYQRAGRAMDADRFYSAALRADSMMSDVAARAIIARLQAGRRDSAAALARAAVLRFPQVTAVAVAAFTALLEAGSPAEAREIGERLAAGEPGRWEYQQLLGDAAIRLGDCASAREHLERASGLAPAEPGPRQLIERLNASCGGPR